MKKFLYVGAYIELGNLAEGYTEPYKKFIDFINEDWEKYDEYSEGFIFPYQGLEGYNILMPCDGTWGKHMDEYEEHIWSKEYLKTIDFNGFEEYLKEEYKYKLELIESVIDKKDIHIKSGIIDYWDERA